MDLTTYANERIFSHGNRIGMIRKTIRIMKLLFVLMFLACLQVSATGTAQITIHADNTPLEKVLREIKRQSNYAIFYDKDILVKSKPVTADIKNVPLEQALQHIFKDQPITYEIVADKIITLKEKSIKLIETIAEVEAPPPFEVSGRVIDSTGAALAGASVMVKNTNTGIKTDAYGTFTLKGIASDVTLVISFTGYFTKEVRLNGNPTLTVVLYRNDNPLDEVQVIAYGTTTRRLNTANVSTVKAEEIARQPVSNPILTLQGRVPGVLVTQTSGLAGASVKIQVQGRNSLTQGSDPFFVVDGVPYTNSLSTMSGSTPLGTGSPLNYINPADIESIDVLKDADATSIYGSRAANGAILITTKKGKAGKTKVDLTLQQGWAEVGHKLNLLNTQQYMAMRHEALKNDNLMISPTDYDLNGVFDSSRYTDWQNELIGGKAQYTDIQASVSGGNDNTRFLLSGTYHRETSVFPSDFADRKGSFFLNVNHLSTNKKFRVQLNTSYLVDDNRQIRWDLTEFAMRLVPHAPALYNENGELNWAPLPDGTSSWTNPLAYSNYRYHGKTGNLLANAVVSYELLKGLELKTSFGFSKLQSNESNLDPSSRFKPEFSSTVPRSANYAYSFHNSWIIEPQISYKRNISHGKFTALLGASIDQRNNNLRTYEASDFTNDAAMLNPKAASTITIGTVTDIKYKYNAIFGQFNFNWQEKYIVNLSARRDGSSRFGPENLFQNFGSVGLAWIFSNEPFAKNIAPIVNFGKLRASYGTTGNDQIGDYTFMSLYNFAWQDRGYQNIQGIEPTNFTNPYLQWEETKKLNLGATLGFLNDKILIDVNHYQYRSSNQLLSYKLPILTGFWGVMRNFPATLQNTGWEASLTTTNISTTNFQWTTGLNITFRKNKLIDFPGLETSSYYNSLIIGQPVRIQKVFHFLGVDPTTGLYYFEDSHGKPTSYPSDLNDKNTIVNTEPKFFGGFQNAFVYKNFRLDILFNFVKQTGLEFTYGTAPGFFDNTAAIGNQPASVLNRWKNIGDMATVQRYNSNFSVYQPAANLTGSSDGAYTDASYIKLKNVSFSWILPAKLTHKAYLQEARVFVHGQNLFTITGYYGLDPESKSSMTLPPLRTITIGCQITL